MNILRFITAGSVDDGKSTLIGRLLYDSKSILQDQLEAIERSSKKNDNGEIDLALLTDGLRAEREQGITIDVAYKYFSTPKRKFIIADAPGHIQYTRNMVTGASTANLAVILVDARHGVIEQTYRHSFISTLLGIPHLVIAINKMDLVDYSEEAYEKIKSDYLTFIKKINTTSSIDFFPISALKGDNIVDQSESMKWYKGKPLLSFLEEVNVTEDLNFTHPRFPVQYVIRPQTEELHDYRGYAGRVAAGIFKPGDKVKILPAETESAIEKIEFFDKKLEEAFSQQSVIMHLKDDVDISRGDVIVGTENAPTLSKEVEVDMCWMDSKPLTVGAKYSLLKNSSSSRCVIKEILHKTDVNSLEKEENPDSLKLNDIARVRMKLSTPVVFDDYKQVRTNGSAILVDESTHGTVAACMLREKLD